MQNPRKKTVTVTIGDNPSMEVELEDGLTREQVEKVCSSVLRIDSSGYWIQKPGGKPIRMDDNLYRNVNNGDVLFGTPRPEFGHE